MNQYFFQMILYIYKEWIDPLFLRRKTTVIHHINVLLSYLPMSTLSRLFKVVEPAVCSSIFLVFCSFSFYTTQRNMLQRDHIQQKLVQQKNQTNTVMSYSIAHELIRFEEGRAYKCSPSTIRRKPSHLEDIFYYLQKTIP